MLHSVPVCHFLVLLVALAGAAAAHNHACIHDTDEFQAEQASLLQRPPLELLYRPPDNTVDGRRFRAEAAQPLRIVFSYDDLTRTGGFCASASGTAPSYRSGGGTVSCTDADKHVLTEAKRNILKNNILPAAVTRIQQFLSVEPVLSNIRASSTGVCGVDWTIPASHVSTGVASADLVIYVASSPIPGTTAFAGACALDTNGRAVIGRMNYDTEELKWTGVATTDQLAVDVAVHEIFHILGVTASELNANGRTTTATKRGKTVTMVTTPTVRQFVRDFTGCTTLAGAELEDEGQGSSSAHWERKLWLDEAMCGVAGPKLSRLSLGFLHDMNVGYTVALSSAETMVWGANTGCNVHDFKCNTLEGGRYEYFCFDDPNNRPSRCTFNLKAIGRCTVDTQPTAFPALFQYYSNAFVGGDAFMDGCPYVQGFSNRQCAIDTVETSNDVTFGYTYLATSRCFNTTGVIQDGFSASNIDGPRCLEATCSSSSQIAFRIGSSAYATCGAQYSVTPSPSGYKGSISCPNPAEMCASLSAQSAPIPVPPGVTATATPPNANPTPTSTPAATPTATVTDTTTTTVRATLTFQGSAFGTIQASSTLTANLRVALQEDIAAGLALSTSAVTITQLSITNGTLVVEFDVTVTERTAASARTRIESWAGDSTPFGRTTAVYRQADPNAAALAPTSAAASSAMSALRNLPMPLLAVVLGALLIGGASL